jgi:hypothetical protein
MLGEQEARVLEFKPFLLHGVTYYDVTVAYQDRSVGHAPAGSGGRPENRHPGEVVVAMRAANMIVSLQRPGEATGDVRSPPPASAARGATGATEPRHRDRPSTTPPAGVAGVHGPYGVAEGSEPTQ